MAMLRRQKDTDAARRKKTGRPIFRTIFNAMMLVMLVEVVLLAVSIAITNVDGRLNQNAKDMLNMQVRNQDAQNLTDKIGNDSRNAPFSNERWLLIGTVNSKVLFAFADNVRNVIAIAIVFTLVLGALGSLVVARNLAYPVELLYHEVVDGQEKSCPIPTSGSWTVWPMH